LDRATNGTNASVKNEEARIAAIIDKVNQRNGGSPYKVTIIENAEPAVRPVRPNRPLTIFMGAVCGILLGIVAGVIAALLTSRFKKRSAASPPPVPAT
jgi:capsular polysaccharide biosynthesis protein